MTVPIVREWTWSATWSIKQNVERSGESVQSAQGACAVPHWGVCSALLGARVQHPARACVQYPHWGWCAQHPWAHNAVWTVHWARSALWACTHCILGAPCVLGCMQCTKCALLSLFFASTRHTLLSLFLDSTCLRCTVDGNAWALLRMGRTRLEVRAPWCALCDGQWCTSQHASLVALLGCASDWR